uniref:Uncharacterized protein n=1 Tax=Molossus molossus TaxID=27622 RepID=A0A7J8GQY1_MOLMO|nr:hypothetical protein HJG59_011351 [Molossus molossus]
MCCFAPNQLGDELESSGKGLQCSNQNPTFFLFYYIVEYATYVFSPLFFWNICISLSNGLQGLENAQRHLLICRVKLRASKVSSAEIVMLLFSSCFNKLCLLFSFCKLQSAMHMEKTESTVNIC